MLPWDCIFTDLRGSEADATEEKREVGQSRLTAPFAGDEPWAPRGPSELGGCTGTQVYRGGGDLQKEPRGFQRVVRLPHTQSLVSETPGWAMVGPEGPSGEAGRATRSPIQAPCESGRPEGTLAQPNTARSLGGQEPGE